MKNKIVLWGTNEADERILVALELKIKKNKVMLYTFSEAIATDDFHKMMMDEWRDKKEETTFPEGHQAIERELSITESLLPENIKVERTDIIQQAQTEWHFVVLSSKLSEAYRNELKELEEKIAALKEFDKDVWESLKAFWAKVQVQMRDRTILREHADALRQGTNQGFEALKAMRSKMEEGFRKTSAENLDRFNAVIDDVEKRISENKHLSKVFEELKKVQKDIKGFDFTREHRNKLWNRVDKAFKEVKTKRFGDQGADNNNSPLQRTNSRYTGLLSAIDRMQKSIGRDENELAFQARQIDRTDGQLEAQIRQAKLQMIEQRVSSKREKLDDMLKTKTQLEERMARETEQEAKRKEKRAADAAKAAAKKEAKEKIAQDIKAKQASVEADTDALANAAQAINEQKGGAKKKATPKAAPETPAENKEEAKTAVPDESIFSAIATTIGESLEDVVDTIKAVAEVVGDQIEEKADAIKEDLKDMKEEVEKDFAEAKAEVKAKMNTEEEE